MEIQLVEISPRLKDAFLRMAKDFAANGEEEYVFMLEDQFNFDDYVTIIRNREQGEGLPAHYIPDTHYYLTDDTDILGIIRVRHGITDRLRKDGGNVSYLVPPSQRKKGYGTRILKEALPRIKEKGISPIVLTCNADNLGAKKVIEANGGVLEEKYFSETKGRQRLRYIIP